MSNYVEIEFTDTYEDLARKINSLDSVAPLERKAASPESLRGTEIESYDIVSSGWTRRVSGWFRRS